MCFRNLVLVTTSSYLNITSPLCFANSLQAYSIVYPVTLIAGFNSQNFDISKQIGGSVDDLSLECLSMVYIIENENTVSWSLNVQFSIDVIKLHA
ncbi:hypothetical protein FGO68_gene12128 [Halteria grandinella]|uniref:Uncharacterized protein n=1 Tax=Halteria grandinella TaxID=5974 RepID=A0A8J8P6Y2_HALGN|nr:hypothetical protein FGO68_gene12128 [Halteria grandinella]